MPGWLTGFWLYPRVRLLLGVLHDAAVIERNGLIAASLTASASLAAMSTVNPAFSQNLDAQPKRVVLLPPQIFEFELSAGGVQTRIPYPRCLTPEAG
jgi:hypothetical protein